VRAQNTGAKSDIIQISKSIESFKQLRGSGEGVLFVDIATIGTTLVAGSSVLWDTAQDRWVLNGDWQNKFAGASLDPNSRFDGVMVIKTAGKRHQYDYSTSDDFNFGAYGCNPGIACAKHYCLVTNQVATTDIPNPKAFAVRNGVASDLTLDKPTWVHIPLEDQDTNVNVCI
jgi:hypothetical protein